MLASPDQDTEEKTKLLSCTEDSGKVMKEEPGIVISSSGDKVPEDKYLSWKNQTLALQTSHKAEKQRTGLWQDFKDINVVENINYRGEQNEFLVELAPGWRCEVILAQPVALQLVSG